ncbi:g1197 [Coccomyxa elongata]
MPDTTYRSPRLTAVAKTAMLVAAARLAEAKHEQPVLTDELLEAIIGSSGEVVAAMRQCIQETQQQEREDGVNHVASFTSVRMKFGDSQLVQFRASHVSFQVVILGAGLDTRPWRLDLGSGVSIYDIDQKDMTEFKNARLLAADAQLQMDGKTHRFPLRCGSWKGVPLDLTGSWLPGLLLSGLSTDVPTVWVAEGLFYYMDQEAGSALLKTMASASTPDSMLIMTHLNHALFTASQRFISDGDFPTDEKIKTFYSSWKSGMPENVGGYLASCGWRVDSQQLMSEIHKEYGVQLARWKNTAEMRRKYEPELGTLDYWVVVAHPMSVIVDKS